MDCVRVATKDCIWLETVGDIGGYEYCWICCFFRYIAKVQCHHCYLSRSTTRLCRHPRKIIRVLSFIVIGSVVPQWHPRRCRRIIGRTWWCCCWSVCKWRRIDWSGLWIREARSYNTYQTGSPAVRDATVGDGGDVRIWIISDTACCKYSWVLVLGIGIVFGMKLTVSQIRSAFVFGK